jgi:hypothetical protein
MGEYVQQFMDQSTKLTQYVRNQLEKVGLWTNVPGGLAKIAVSPAGYIWGYSSEFNVYSCKEPCNGNWTMYERIPGDVFQISDIKCDNENVYVMIRAAGNSTEGEKYSKHRIGIRPVDGSGAWRFVRTPLRGSGRQYQLAVSDSFIFTGFSGCAKPCATETWVDAPVPAMGELVSASANYTYGVSSSTGKAATQRSNASMQTGWEDLPGLEGVIPVAVESDNTAIYGNGQVGPGSQNPVKCTPPYDSKDSCKPLDTGGRTPTSMSVNPTTNALYMTTVEPGPGGNIFQRIDTDNGPEVLAYSDKAVKELDRDVNSLGGEIRIQNAEIRTGDTLKEASDVIHEATSLHGPIESTQQDSQKLRRQILGSSQDSTAYTSSLLPLQILAATLLGLFVVFALLGFVLPTTVTSGLAVLILAGGFGAAIYFVVKKQ